MRPYYFEHIPGNGIAIRLRKALSRAVKHSDSRLLIELSAADSSGSLCTFSSRSAAFGCTSSCSSVDVAFCMMFSRVRLSVERMIAKLVRLALLEHPATGQWE